MTRGSRREWIGDDLDRAGLACHRQNRPYRRPRFQIGRPECPPLQIKNADSGFQTERRRRTERTFQRTRRPYGSCSRCISSGRTAPECRHRDSWSTAKCYHARRTQKSISFVRLALFCVAVLRSGPGLAVFGLELDPSQSVQKSISKRDILKSHTLYQCHFTFEVWLLFSVELQGHAAGGSDSLQHCERVPAVFRVLKTRNRGLRSAHLPGKFGLSQTRVLSHLADQKSQVDLMQCALERLSVGCALSCALLRNPAMSVTFGGLSHRLNSFRIASLSFGDPV